MSHNPKLLRLTAVATALALLSVGSAFAQAYKRAADITVSKNTDPTAGVGMYTTVQAAVNAAKAGDIIEILDVSVYEEQVTIDGRETSPWTGIRGGKNGITIRYVPSAANSAAFSSHVRPTIKYRDITNTSPKNATEAAKDGELSGMSGNYETCAAVRVLYADGVTLEGIAVDGGSAYPFGWSSVWSGGGGVYPLFHGNTAISLAASGNVTIRECDIKNAYFGMYVKDRNIGGVFGNPNPSDNDIASTIPLSGFGKSGNHLVEYNRINNNSVAMFFESSWDLGSTVRYNLIYDNAHTAATKTALGTGTSGIPGTEDDKSAGAFMFKDTYLSPIAIYNNTLYNNTTNFIGNWQVGMQHLIFNNIFSKSTPSANSPTVNMDGMLMSRMNSCVFSADATSQNALRIQCQTNFDCAGNNLAPGGCFLGDVRVPNQYGVSVPYTRTTLISCNPDGTPYGGGGYADMVLPGTLIASTSGGSINAPTITASANIRWLQTEGGSITDSYRNGPITLDPLFQSLDPASPSFLVPKWDHPQVIEFIKNKGWPDAGIRNSNGQLADLGAIPSTGTRATTVARIVPTNIVTLSSTGSIAATSFSLKLPNGGVFSNPKIKMLRWIAPLPDNKESYGINATPIPTTSIRNIPAAQGAAAKTGNNSFTFNTGTTYTALPMYGFFEITIEGKDASGNDISSDVGFLPYRQLEYYLDVAVFPPTGAMTTPLTEVVAGEPVRLRVRPINGATGASFTGTLNEVSYRLLSSGSSFMYISPAGSPLLRHSGTPFAGPAGAEYGVYFTRAGDESILASGYYKAASATSEPLAFLGGTSVKVLSGDPATITMLAPTPKSKIPDGATPPLIHPEASYEVLVEVRDDFGNPVDVAVPVTAVSSNPLVASVAPATAQTDPATGIAAFTVSVIGGGDGDVFDITATLPLTGGSDVGRLQISSDAPPPVVPPVEPPPISVLADERSVPKGASPSADGVTVITPITIKPDNQTAWLVSVKNNPFRSGLGNTVTLEISPNVKAGGGRDARADVKAAITIFDDNGNAVLKKSVVSGKGNGGVIKYEWDGVDRKGRPVGTGVYLIRASCVDRGGKDRAVITRSVGVIRR